MTRRKVVAHPDDAGVGFVGFELQVSAWPARLDQALHRMGLTSTQLAREMGLDASIINRYRSGDRTPSPTRLAYLIRRANASADEILGLRPSMRDELIDELETNLMAFIADMFKSLKSDEPGA
jgi:transcriptional regulator with XRE-family HTH domain